MDTIWYQIIFAFVGGSLCTYLVTLFIQSGKLEIDSVYAKVSCKVEHFVQYINYFTLEIQFINRSAHLRVVNNLEVNFYDGEKIHKLLFKDHNVSPAGTIEGRKEKLLHYTLLPPVAKLELPLISLFHDNTAYLSLSYNYKGRKHEITIVGDQIVHEDDTFGTIAF